MLIIFFLIVMLKVGRCSDNLMLELKTVTNGDYVTLTCSRLNKEFDATLHWVRFVSGNKPEYLGGTFSFDYDVVNKTPHFTVKQEPGNFSLHISKSNLSDAGLYYCMKIDILDLTFLKGTFLRVKGPSSNISGIIQEPPSVLVHPGDPVSLQCSVLFNAERKTCPAEHSVYWFRAGTDESHPSLIYTNGNSGDGCKSHLEANSEKKCIYSFSKNISSSDAGTYYCAVAACGEILFGNGTELDIGVPGVWDLQTANTVIILLSTVLTASVIVICLLTCFIKKKTCGCCEDTVTARDQHSQQRDANLLTYSTPTFTMRNTNRGKKKNEPTSGAIYTGIAH